MGDHRPTSLWAPWRPGGPASKIGNALPYNGKRGGPLLGRGRGQARNGEKGSYLPSPVSGLADAVLEFSCLGYGSRSLAGYAREARASISRWLPKVVSKTPFETHNSISGLARTS